MNAPDYTEWHNRLIPAGEKYAEPYEGEAGDALTIALNAFYAGAAWGIKNPPECHKSDGGRALAAWRAAIDRFREDFRNSADYDDRHGGAWVINDSAYERAMSTMDAAFNAALQATEGNKPGGSERPKWAEGCGQYPHCPCNETRNCTEREEQ